MVTRTGHENLLYFTCRVSFRLMCFGYISGIYKILEFICGKDGEEGVED